MLTTGAVQFQFAGVLLNGRFSENLCQYSREHNACPNYSDRLKFCTLILPKDIVQHGTQMSFMCPVESFIGCL